MVILHSPLAPLVPVRTVDEAPQEMGPVDDVDRQLERQDYYLSSYQLMTDVAQISIGGPG